MKTETVTHWVYTVDEKERRHLIDSLNARIAEAQNNLLNAATVERRDLLKGIIAELTAIRDQL